jgi:hypothetical protein
MPDDCEFSMSIDERRLLPIVGVVVIIAIGVAYMIFLASTWTQLQTDRRNAYAKVDAILDQIEKTKTVEVKPEVAVPDEVASG